MNKTKIKNLKITTANLVKTRSTQTPTMHPRLSATATATIHSDCTTIPSNNCLSNNNNYCNVDDEQQQLQLRSNTSCNNLSKSLHCCDCVRSSKKCKNDNLFTSRKKKRSKRKRNYR